jgi:hypothetical protein
MTETEAPYTAYPNPIWETPLTLENICSELCGLVNPLAFFTMEDASGKVLIKTSPRLATSSTTSFRLISKEFKWNIENYPWNDFNNPSLQTDLYKSRVIGKISSWKACFPYARSINLVARYDIRDADFIHLNEVSYILLQYSCGTYSDSIVSQEAFDKVPNLFYIDMRNCVKLHSYIPYFIQRGVRILV